MPKKNIIAIDASVTIEAAEGEEKKGPRSFTSTFYTGGPLNVGGYDLPVVVDLAGLKNGKVLVANLDHDASKRVGNFQVANDGRQLVANGVANAATAARDEVINSAKDGYQWQASLEVAPQKIEQLAKGKTVEVNGQQITGPAYITREGTLKGFAFVSHGADDNTSATIAASAASSTAKGNQMDAKFKAWIEAMGFDADTLTADQIEGLQANYDGKQATAKPIKASSPFEARKLEAKRKSDIHAAADRLIDQRGSSEAEIAEIEAMCQHAIDAGMSVTEFRLELMDSMAPAERSPRADIRRGPKFNNRVLEAAICQAGRLSGHEQLFDDQTLQMAHDQFKGRIGLKQLLLVAAQDRGYQANYATEVNVEVQRAAFGMAGPARIQATGFSTIDISTILSNVANKFLREGFNAVDMTPLRIAAIRPVNDFKTVTTVSLTGDLQFDKLGASGEIKHGTLGEEVYSNKADTYARMLAITRQDIINDDLGALTAVPRRLGRGAGLKLNDIFWTVFLNNSAFFTGAPRNNVNTGVANMTVGGLTATETIFMNQVDPDGKPLGVLPAILVVPTALKVPANTLMKSERLITGTGAEIGEANPYAGRFRVESSPYMSNASYTGHSAAAWYMIADPAELPMIEIAALNGRVEPVVETADADFNVLGVQMRGYSDVGVNLQEYRAAVRADGGDS
jgi:hypothetical protein